MKRENNADNDFFNLNNCVTKKCRMTMNFLKKIIMVKISLIKNRKKIAIKDKETNFNSYCRQ